MKLLGLKTVENMILLNLFFCSFFIYSIVHMIDYFYDALFLI